MYQSEDATLEFDDATTGDLVCLGLRHTAIASNLRLDRRIRIEWIEDPSWLDHHFTREGGDPFSVSQRPSIDADLKEPSDSC